MKPCSPKVSVIIPVYNDPERLSRCLQAISTQTYPAELVEVIVVDNGSRISPKPVVQAFPRAIFAVEETTGSYAARNRGIELATGHVIGFTDSDCIPDATWIENGIRALVQAGNIGLVAGRVEVFAKDASKPTSIELYECIAAFPQQQYVKSDRFGVTANLFVFRSVIAAVGGFDALQQSGGDREWGQRVHAAGFKICYAEECCVRHPARASFRELRAKIIRVVRGLRDLASKGNDVPINRMTWYVRQIIPPVGYVTRILQDQRLLTPTDRIKAACVMVIARYVMLWELLCTWQPFSRIRLFFRSYAPPKWLA